MYANATAQTALSPLASTVPQVIETTTLPATDDEMMLVDVIFTINTTGTSTAHVQNVAITIGANTATFPFTTSAVITSSTLRVCFAAISRAGDVVNAQLQGGVATDAQTTVNVIGFYIYAISGLPGGT